MNFSENVRMGILDLFHSDYNVYIRYEKIENRMIRLNRLLDIYFDQFPDAGLDN